MTLERPTDMPNMELANKNFQSWNEALQTRDPEKVVALYSADNTFLPTLSAEFKQGQEQAEGYFEHFMQKNPSGEIIQAACQALGPDSYIHSGLYNFTVGPEDKREVVEARFTYVWQKDATGAWKIIHHHSSVKPTK